MAGDHEQGNGQGQRGCLLVLQSLRLCILPSGVRRHNSQHAHAVTLRPMVRCYLQLLESSWPSCRGAGDRPHAHHPRNDTEMLPFPVYSCANSHAAIPTHGRHIRFGPSQGPQTEPPVSRCLMYAGRAMLHMCLICCLMYAGRAMPRQCSTGCRREWWRWQQQSEATASPQRHLRANPQCSVRQ